MDQADTMFASRSAGGMAAGRSARRSARVRRRRAAAVGGRPAVAVPGPDTMIMQRRSDLAAGGPSLVARRLGPGTRAVSQLGHLVGQLAFGRLDQAGRLRLDGPGRL